MLIPSSAIDTSIFYNLEVTKNIDSKINPVTATLNSGSWPETVLCSRTKRPVTKGIVFSSSFMAYAESAARAEHLFCGVQSWCGQGAALPLPKGDAASLEAVVMDAASGLLWTALLQEGRLGWEPLEGAKAASALWEQLSMLWPRDS